jgi:hypothetical protein
VGSCDDAKRNSMRMASSLEISEGTVMKTITV